MIHKFLKLFVSGSYVRARSGLSNLMLCIAK